MLLHISSGVNLQDEGGKKLAVSLQSLSNLTYLDLCGFSFWWNFLIVLDNFIEEEAGAELALAITPLKLFYLDLSGMSTVNFLPHSLQEIVSVTV